VLLVYSHSEVWRWFSIFILKDTIWGIKDTLLIHQRTNGDRTMASIRRPHSRSSGLSSQARAILLALCTGCAILFLSIGLLLSSGGNGSNDVAGVSQRELGGEANKPASLRQGLKAVVQSKRMQLSSALKSLTAGNLPARLRVLRDRHEIVGERLSEVRAGTETVQEILHGHNMEHHVALKPPMELNEIIHYLDTWIHQLHEVLMEAKHATFEGIWQAYHDLTVKTLYPWDRDYLSRMPPRRDDGSVFLSLATYRDENCFNTVYNAYAKAKNPDKLFIGLVQQNCHANCRSGVLSNLSMVEVPPDEDCFQKFCQTDLGNPICANKQLRVLNIDEPESLGPYAARYFASKLWYGESWFMQTDAHMTFATHWDQTSIDMLNKAPSKRPILSHYPPSHTVDLDSVKSYPTSRLCGPVFATSDLESQIIRLEGASVYDKDKLEYPGFAPFTAAGYFVAHSNFLHDVPFDPFLPWIFMGEEIIMSSRLWTSGYDIFAPNEAVVGHIYGKLYTNDLTFGLDTNLSKRLHALNIFSAPPHAKVLGIGTSCLYQRDPQSVTDACTGTSQVSIGVS
jgi:[Skp1-protein]-hydroxyproline N-acetylglucosaminyltransferase